MNATCLRCDWEGATSGSACPRCGAPLYRRPPDEPVRRAAPPPSPVSVAEPMTATAPPPPDSGSGRASPRAILLSTAAVFSVVVFLLARGGLPGPPARVGSSPVSRQTGGRLVYTVPEGEGMARVWRWNLTTDQVSRGPLVRAPVALVNVRSPAHGWLGVTSDDGSGTREASLLDSLDPDARTEPIGSGDIVTWTQRGARCSWSIADRCSTAAGASWMSPL